MKRKSWVRSFAATVLMVFGLGLVQPVPALATCPADLHGQCGGGATPDPSPVHCPDHSLPAFILNGESVCHLDPAPYQVSVPGGTRTMVGFRSIAEAFSSAGLGVLVDYYVTSDGYGTHQFVSAANRHREVLMEVGRRTVRRWAVGQNGTKTEISSVEFDTAPEIVGDRTSIPFRAAVEALGGTITATEPNIRVRYDDNPTRFDFQQAEKIALGAQNAFESSLITLADLYVLVDVENYREAELAKGNPTWARSISVPYIRFATVKEIVTQGHQLQKREYEWLAASLAPIVGRVLTWEDIQEIGRAGERSIDIIAQKFGWKEAGIDPKTGARIDFTQYNQYKRLVGNSNGPDRMYVVTNSSNVIQLYIPAEGKATLRPWVAPSRFAENVPLGQQIENLSTWSEPAVSQPFQLLAKTWEQYLADIEAGTMTWEELYAMFNPVRVATSPSGG